jgi:hypothetical protein
MSRIVDPATKRQIQEPGRDRLAPGFYYFDHGAHALREGDLPTVPRSAICRMLAILGRVRP